MYKDSRLKGNAREIRVALSASCTGPGLRLRAHVVDMGSYSVFKAVGRGMSGCPECFPKNEAQDVSMSEIFMNWREPTDLYSMTRFFSKYILP